MGYTLAPVKVGSPKETANVSGPSFSPEDNEKLKALQELKNEKVKNTLIYQTLQKFFQICDSLKEIHRVN